MDSSRNDEQTARQATAPGDQPAAPSAADQPVPAAPVAETTRPAKKKSKDGHLYQIDFVRLFTFGGVVLDHVILALATNTEVIAHGVGLLLRYTRYCFFALTGFVLTYQYRHRALDTRQFWKRRFKLIGLPFLTWSVFYWSYQRLGAGVPAFLETNFGSPAAIELSLRSITYDLLTGHAAYHLYFLSVSMQIYLVFPAVLWLIKRTDGYHRYLLALSGVFHIWLLYHMLRLPLGIFTDGFLGVIWRNLTITLFPYQFFVFAGCLAAYHFEGFTWFMKRWRWPLALGSIIAIIATLMYYDKQVTSGEEWFRATNVFAVHNMFAFIGIILVLYLAGTAWQNRRTPGSIPDRLLETAADRSFAIYLAHVVVISSLLPVVRAWNIANGWRMFFTFLLVCVFTVYLVEVLRRNPISLITTGRKRVDWRQQDPRVQLAVAAVSIAAGLLIHHWGPVRLAWFFLVTGAILVVGALAVVYERTKNGSDIDEESISV